MEGKLFLLFKNSGILWSSWPWGESKAGHQFSFPVSRSSKSALSEENYWFRWRSVDCKCSDAQPLSLSLASLGWDYSEALIFPLHHVAILCVISEF